MATTTINDSVTQSAELIRDLKATTRLSEATLVKLFEINVGWSLSRHPQQEEINEPTFSQEDADALLAKELGINEAGPAADEVIDSAEPTTALAVVK